MKFCPVNVWLLLFAAGSLAQELDLSDFFDETPAPKNPEKPKSNDDDLNLFDAFGPEPEPKKPSKPAVGDSGDLDILDTLDFDKPAAPTNPKKPASDGFGLDLEDALGPDLNPKPDKPVRPPSTGGGGSFDDSDLLDVGAGGYKPDGGSSGGRSQNPEYDANNNKGGAGDNPQEAGSGQIAGIVSAVGVALLGAASSFFAYQKKKLCFKLQGGADPESGKGHQGTNSEPQVLSNLLSTS